MSTPFLLCAVITLISALVSLGFSVAAALGPAGDRRTAALYTLARSVALVAVCVVPLVNGSTQWLLAVAWAMTIVQAGDATVGVVIRDRLKTYGPAGMAMVNLLAMVWMVQSGTVQIL